MEGKPVNPEQPQKKKQSKADTFQLTEEQMEVVASFLNCVEDSFEKGGDQSQIATILESLIVGPARDKQLKNTKSWATNCLIRLYHSHQSLKEELKQPEFVQQVKAKESVQKWLQEYGAEKWRVEDSGYLTCVDMTPNEQASDATMKEQKQKRPKKGAAQAAEESKQEEAA